MTTQTVTNNADLDTERSLSPMRLLYIYPDTVGLSTDPPRNPLHHLSRYFAGDFLAIGITPGSSARERQREIQAASGRFGFHWMRRNRLPRLLQRVWQIGWYVSTGLRLSRRHGAYDAIVAYGPFSTALAAMILRRLTGARLIVEFTGHPFKSFELHGGRINRIKRRLAPAWTRMVARSADHVRLLYPTQLDDLELDTRGRASVFHGFTTVTSVQRDPAPRTDGKYVLFIGFPFRLKGVDILIRAFTRIADRFPEHRLLIVGHCPDPAPYEALAGGNSRVEIRKPLPHEEAMRLMAGCSVFVLPSRIEAMGRVLLEAMAFGKPVIAAAVGGIPHYIRDGETGLLFESENVQQLADRLATVLGDEDLARRLGRGGHAQVTAELSEEQYAARFRDMVVQALKPPRRT